MGVDPIYGMLPEGWSMVALGELIAEGKADLQTGPFGTALHASSYRPTGTPVIAVANIGDNRLDPTDIPRVDDDTTRRLSRYRVKENDILFGRKGAVERRAIVREQQVGWLQGSDCIRLRFSTDAFSPEYVSYVLGSTAFRYWILQHAHGATMPSLNQEILRLVPLPKPPIGEQYAIAHILSTLDAKIEIDRKMNKTLEAMVRVLYKSWFVDFEPVRAKADGRSPGLSQQIAELFPDAFESSELGTIPSGWELRTIADIAEILGGSTPSTRASAYWDGGVHHWVTPKDLSALTVPILLDTERRITDAGLSQINSGLLPRGTVLLSSRAPIGYLAIAEIPTAINQGFIAMKPKPGISNLFLLFWARLAQGTILSRANGSTFLEISKTNFRPIPIVVPSQSVMDAFESQARPLYHRMVANARESRTLVALRDTLLPKLISGEIRVQGR